MKQLLKLLKRTFSSISGGSEKLCGIFSVERRFYSNGYQLLEEAIK